MSRYTGTRVFCEVHRKDGVHVVEVHRRGSCGIRFLHTIGCLVLQMQKHSKMHVLGNPTSNVSRFIF